MYRFLDRTLANLDGASRLLVSAMRAWVHAAQTGRCKCSGLRPQLAAAGVEDMLGNLALAMHLLKREGVGTLRFAATGSSAASPTTRRGSLRCLRWRFPARKYWSEE